MILPCDGDDPEARNGKRRKKNGLPDEGEGEPEPGCEGEEAEGSAAADYAHSVQKPAGPGWREDLKRELIACIDDLREIEDPDEDFDPPEPPDLYTFFGELAALRNEVRRSARRSSGALERLEELIGAAQEIADRPAGSAARPEAWPQELCLALISLYDLIAEHAPGAALETAFQPLARQAGLARVETVGKPFDPERMTVTGVEVSTSCPPGHVIRETEAGFLRAGVLVRPARVILSG